MISKGLRSGFFITGTDTGVGKTYVAVRLLTALMQQGYATVGLKPIATGSDGPHPDAVALQQAASLSLDYAAVNPYCFVPVIAPSIAAEQLGVKLSVQSLVAACQPGLQAAVDVRVIEGIGGWQVPLNATETLADFAVALGLPVILVVGLRLGCLNHALLTGHSMRRLGLSVAGWFANLIDPHVLAVERLLKTLEYWLPYPFLGLLPYARWPVMATDPFQRLFTLYGL